VALVETGLWSSFVIASSPTGDPSNEVVALKKKKSNEVAQSRNKHDEAQVIKIYILEKRSEK
jgi:hypothetical protein